jgi:hypothetical protein
MDDPFAPFEARGFSSDNPAFTNMALLDAYRTKPLPPHSSHPDFGHLTVLVFQAVLEVVFVASPGYILARRGMFNAESQKFLAELNVNLFTPCLSQPSVPFEQAIAFANHLQSSTNSPRSFDGRIYQASH